MTRPVFLAGTGTYLPGPPIPFDGIDAALGPLPDAPAKLRRWMETTREVMRGLLAVQVVHYAFDPATREVTDDNVTMATKAARVALTAADLPPDGIDLICYGSPHQDQMPTASVRIQEALGIASCAELSVHANCTSAYKALFLAHELIASGRYRNALVVSANVASSELRSEYYNQPLADRESVFLRWFLCDGAGAAVLSADADRSTGYEVEQTYIESVGGTRPAHMYNRRPAYWMNPREEFDRGLHHLRQTFRNALASDFFNEGEGSVFVAGLRRMLAQGNAAPESIRRFHLNLPAKHVAETVMAEVAALGIPRAALFTRLDRLGYSGPPMALIGLDAMVREEALAEGDRAASFVTEVSKFMQAGFVLRRHGTAR
jgi:3-oxoacyl-[acyl-carrier-protein] synthase III